ncbi:putative acetyltransferase [mine drainage metagenome]|uniref:Putative acetyltransferase n=1 Tax=mine drainage metagenome TaxID=410659 RepID=A0A1J5PWP5_9ZZZZ
MESEIAIREAVIEDAPAIARVNFLTWRHAYRGLIPDSELDSLNLEGLTDRWQQNLNPVNPRSGTLVVETGDSLIAYSRFYPSLDPGDDQDSVATIGSMYVIPEFHRKGIGRKLMGRVLAAANEHGFTEANLHVLAANDLARKFYEDLGWEVDLDVKIKGSGEETVPKVRYRKNQL